MWVGIDYFGPLLVTVGRSSVTRRGQLITCLTTRAIHLQISWPLDTESFLCSFDRFIYNRGKPAKVFSAMGLALLLEKRSCGADLSHGI